MCVYVVFFFKQKTAYERRISDWSADVCSSDLPDGKPVANAKVSLSLRAQQLSMVDNELQYLGQFPVELTSSEVTTDAKGNASLELPAADKPSRDRKSVV